MTQLITWFPIYPEASRYRLVSNDTEFLQYLQQIKNKNSYFAYFIQ